MKDAIVDYIINRVVLGFIIAILFGVVMFFAGLKLGYDYRLHKEVEKANYERSLKCK